MEKENMESENTKNENTESENMENKNEKNVVFRLKVVIAILALLVVALGAFAIHQLFFNDSTDSDASNDNPPTVSDANPWMPPEDIAPEFPTVDFSYELVLGDIVITRPEYNFYFMDFMFQRHERYFMQFGFEPFNLFEPLENQMHMDGTQTWADYIHGLIEDVVRQYAQAREAGIRLTDENIEILEEYELWLMDMAQAEGLSLDDFISSIYAGMTGELFLRFIERDMLIHEWMFSIIDEITFTLEELEAFYYENWEEIDPWNAGVRNTLVSNADARHILVAFPDDTREPTEAEMEDARLAAEAIFAEWYEGEATEDSFAELAAERTEDFASAATGGLYTNIFPGQMVSAFDAWVFDESRQPGDTGIVETNFGFHIMYFVRAHIDWERRAEAALTERIFTERLDELTDRFTVERRRV